MKISLCNEVLREHSFERQCALAAELGYDGLEIAPFTLGERPWEIPAATRAAMRTAAADHGIAITGMHALLYTPAGLSITTEDDAAWRFTRDVLRWLMDLTVELGADLMVHGSPKARMLAPGREAEGRKRGYAMFHAVAPHAEALGITYCIEALPPDETSFVNRIDEALAIVEAIGNPAVRTMIDTCAVAHAESESVPDIIRRTLVGGQIAHIHLNDPNRRGPGEGKMAFGPILEALLDCGYQGNCAVEPFIYKPDGPSCAARQIGYLRGLLERRRSD